MDGGGRNTRRVGIVGTEKTRGGKGKGEGGGRGTRERER